MIVCIIIWNVLYVTVDEKIFDKHTKSARWVQAKDPSQVNVTPGAPFINMV